MKTRHLSLILFFLAFAMISCGIYPTSSKFAGNAVSLGMNKAEVIKKMGSPFRADSYYTDKKIDVLFYKEPTRVDTYSYIVTTTLRFENDTLKSINQNDRFMPDSNNQLYIDSIHK